MGSRQPAVIAACGALCASALALGVPSALANPRASAPHWRVVARTPSWMNVAIAPTATSAWAFGWGAHEPEGPIFPIGRHWNGHRWSRVQFPGGVKNSGMSCAGASAPDNVWAFSGAGAAGGNPPSTVSALRLRGRRWVIVRNFPGSYVTGCDVLSPTNVWVFGGALAGLGPPIGTWHMHGSTWTLINTGHLVLFHASVVSAHDIWAIGANELSLQPVMGRWNGHTWREIRSIDAALPRPTKTTRVGLDAANAISGHDVWVLASVAGSSGITRFVVVHWNGNKWSRVGPRSPGYYLPTAVSDGHGGWWSPPYLSRTAARYLLHRARRQWTRFPLPVQLSLFPGSSPGNGIVHVPSSNAMLLAGTQVMARGVSGVILAFGRLPA